MKKLILIAILSVWSYSAFSQDVNRSIPEYVYCEITGRLKTGNSWNLEFDFGALPLLPSFQKMNDAWKKAETSNVVDIINLSQSYGWEFVQAYNINTFLHYIIRIDLDDLPSGEKAQILQKLKAN